jgi:predicted DNA-binding ArsR family transcriptional regulator
MEITELMIGCLVTGKKWRENPFQITRINDGGKFVYGKTATSTVGPFLLDELEPILITPEILEMNGFTENYRYDALSYIQSCGAVTGIHINGKNGEMEEMYFKYVHEVQNALRLCGLNDLADDFKLEG